MAVNWSPYLRRHHANSTIIREIMNFVDILIPKIIPKHLYFLFFSEIATQIHGENVLKKMFWVAALNNLFVLTREILEYVGDQQKREEYKEKMDDQFDLADKEFEKLVQKKTHKKKKNVDILKILKKSHQLEQEHIWHPHEENHTMGYYINKVKELYRKIKKHNAQSINMAAELGHYLYLLKAQCMDRNVSFPIFCDNYFKKSSLLLLLYKVILSRHFFS